jgi:hypothetical protein
MHKLIDLYNRINSFVAYNMLLFANFSLLLIICFDLPFLIPKIYILISAYLFIGLAGYFINDYFDIDKDRLSNKFNVTHIINKYWVILAIVTFIAIGLQLVTLVSKYAPYVVYLEIILLVLYSSKPTRLKEKGFLGILTDSAYSHTLPSIIIIQIINEYVIAPYWFWLLFVCLNSCIGIRDILIHQSIDFEKDVKSETNTFYTKHVLLSNKLILWFEDFVSFMLIALIGSLCLEKKSLAITTVFLFVLLSWIRYKFKKLREINYVIRSYILSSSILIFYLSTNRLSVLALLIHPYNFHFTLHFIKNLNSNIIGPIKRILSLIEHLYKSKFTLLINYTLYYFFIPFGRNLKSKPLYKKKLNNFDISSTENNKSISKK